MYKCSEKNRRGTVVVQWNPVCFGLRGVSKHTGSYPVHGPSQRLVLKEQLELRGEGGWQLETGKVLSSSKNWWLKKRPCDAMRCTEEKQRERLGEENGAFVF
ncbi:hypothetical protein E2C01_050647 [Portunus trituberculatus]|uniref:Uncharacterized protein n=1 Tax=Portunus trituberculatus TaxID=210409 RepID=A0A5B7GCN7_PORTR|nr:hypothetical protein [Portunus trituberculatus]